MLGASIPRQGVGCVGLNINQHRYIPFSSSSDPINSGWPGSNLTSTPLSSSSLLFSFSRSAPYRYNPRLPSWLQHHLSGMEQQESRRRAMVEEWETTWMARSLCTTRWICRSPAFHNLCWGKMDVSRSPLDRKSKKCHRSHGEWIVLRPFGNVISLSARTEDVFSC